MIELVQPIAFAGWYMVIGGGLALTAQSMRREYVNARAAKAADEAVQASLRERTQAHETAHAPVATPLRSRPADRLRVARLRVAVEAAAVRDHLALLRRRVVVRPMPELELSVRSWLERDRQSDELWLVNTAPAPAEPVASKAPRYQWPVVNAAVPSPVEPVEGKPVGRVPVQRMDLVSHARRWNADYQRLLEQKRAESESLQDTGLIERVVEPVAS